MPSPFFNTMLRVGLTGGIASGKSLLLRLLQEQGAVVFSADEAARAILTPHGEVLRQIREVFGESVFEADGTLFRSRLAALIFQDAEARRTLNRITHPPLLRLLSFQIESAQYELSPETVVVVEVPLLYEDHLQSWFDLVVVVSSTREVCLQRLMERNGLTREEGIKRLQSQKPLEEKAAYADIVVENNGEGIALRDSAKSLWETLKRQNVQKSFEI